MTRGKEATGVLLGGRTLSVAEIIFSEYKSISAYDAICRFTKEMYDAPRLTSKLVDLRAECANPAAFAAGRESSITMSKKENRTPNGVRLSLAEGLRRKTIRLSFGNPVRLFNHDLPN